MTCKVCTSKVQFYQSATILNKYKISYYKCDHCGFLQTEDPYWLTEAYADAIADTDTGLVQRNIHNSKVLACLLYFFFGKNGKYADFAGGYGMLTRLMRDYGFDYYWSDKYCMNMLAKGFENDKTDPPFTAISAFEVLEHVREPLYFLKETLSESVTKTIIFSTETYEGEAPPLNWWYYALNSGQHISFFQKRTLQFIADQLGLFFYSNGSTHLLTDKIVNPLLCKILLSRVSSLLYIYVRIKMRSKMMSDHEQLIKK